MSVAKNLKKGNACSRMTAGAPLRMTLGGRLISRLRSRARVYLLGGNNKQAFPCGRRLVCCKVLYAVSICLKFNPFASSSASVALSLPFNPYTHTQHFIYYIPKCLKIALLISSAVCSMLPEASMISICSPRSRSVSNTCIYCARNLVSVSAFS